MRKTYFNFLLLAGSLFAQAASAQAIQGDTAKQAIQGAAAKQGFKFAHISDTHVGGAVTAADDLRSTVRDINADTSLKFVIITGDITEFGADVELQLAKSIFDSLNKPWYIIPGNHDANWSESGANAFRTVFASETIGFAAHVTT